jgi:hypothetical protein
MMSWLPALAYVLIAAIPAVRHACRDVRRARIRRPALARREQAAACKLGEEDHGKRLDR